MTEMKPQDHERKKNELRQRIDELETGIDAAKTAREQTGAARLEAEAESWRLQTETGQFDDDDDSVVARTARRNLADARKAHADARDAEQQSRMELGRLTTELQRTREELAAVQAAETVEYRLCQYRETLRRVSDAKAYEGVLREEEQRLGAELTRRQDAITQAEQKMDESADLASVDKASRDYEDAMRGAENVTTLLRNLEQQIKEAQTATSLLQEELEKAKNGVWEAKHRSLLDRARNSIAPVLRAYACTVKVHGSIDFTSFVEELLPDAKQPTDEAIQSTIQKLGGELGAEFIG